MCTKNILRTALLFFYILMSLLTISNVQAGYAYFPYWQSAPCRGSNQFVYSSHDAAASAASVNCISTVTREISYYNDRYGNPIYDTLTQSSGGIVKEYPSLDYSAFIKAPWLLTTNFHTERPAYDDHPSYSWTSHFITRILTVSDGKAYSIKISPVTARAYGNYLTAIEPDGITRSKIPEHIINEVNLVAEVKDQDGNRVNAAIKLKVTAIDGSGGHNQESHTERNPSQAGKLKYGNLNSHTIDIPKSEMTDGIVEFIYAASEVSGDHKIEASCTDITCNQIGQDSVWVGIQDLRTLPSSSNYTFTGGSCHHQNNHYATERVIEKIQGLGRLYRSQFPNDPILVFNDISLERGGLFDAKNEDDCSPLVKANWTATHNLHRTGEDVDVRANKTATAIPEENYKAFKQIAKRNGCFAEPHKSGTPAQHFHLYCTQKQGE